MQHPVDGLRLLKCSVLAIVIVVGAPDCVCSGQTAQPAPEPKPAASTLTLLSEPGEDIGRLMLKLDAEIANGRLSSPGGDNALDTLRQIIALVSRATPPELEAIEQLPSRFDQRASDARRRGDDEAADRFVALRKAFTPDGGQTAFTEERISPRSGLAPSHPPASIPMIAALTKRGEEKLSQGDLVVARLFFMRAAEARSGAGAAGFAKTYDPLSLRELGLSHTRADAGLAEEWYRKAVALGDGSAVASLGKLEKWRLESAAHLTEQSARHP